MAGLQPTMTLLALWPFASGWMLLWALSAALPVLIHLLSRRRYRPTQWAATIFLLAAIRRTTRRVRLEQRVLLAIRVLILLLLALAMADPVFSIFPTFGAPLGLRQNTHWVLVIDGSYSMEFRSDEVSRFERARKLATELVERAGQGDGFSIVLMSQSPDVVIGDPAFDPADVVREIQGLAPRHGGARLEPALLLAEQLLDRATKFHPRLKNRRVCFLSDLDQATWSSVNAPLIAQRLERLSEQTRISVFDVGRREPNLMLSALALAEPVPTLAEPTTFYGEIANFGDEDRRTRVELFVDDQRVAERQIEVPGQGAAPVSFVHRFSSAGDHRVEFRLEPDALAVDNHRWLVCEVRPAIRVLCVQGKPQAARYLEMALAPTTQVPQRVEVEVQWESVLLEADLENYDAIVLSNLAEIGEAEHKALIKFVERGGGLIVFLGDAVEAEKYNALSRSRSGRGASPSLLPARLNEIETAETRSLDPLDYAHPLIDVFRGNERAGLLTTPVWRYYRLELLGSGARTAVAFDNGDPAIVEHRFGRGRCLVVATAGSAASYDNSTSPPTPWTALATWPSFVPLVQEMLTFVSEGSGSLRNVTVFEPLVMLNWESATAPTMIGPNRTTGRVRRDVDGWSFDATELTGVYEMQLTDRTRLYAVNLEPRAEDSKGRRIDATELPAAMIHNPEIDDFDTLVAGPAVLPRAHFFRHVLGLVLVLLIVDISWAAFMGRRA